MRSDRHTLGACCSGMVGLLFLVGMLGVCGCDELGVAAHTLAGEQDVLAAYPGLKGQKVGIMVWADEAISADHPSVEPDIAEGLQGKLKEAADAKAKEVQGIRWMKTDDILRFQEAHPELETDTAEQLAAQLPVTRLIYIEVVSLTTHPNDAVDLWRGTVVANMRVVEVEHGKGTVAYSEDNVSGVYPSDAPPEGMPGLQGEEVYRRAIDKLTTELAMRFVTHEADAQ